MRPCLSWAAGAAVYLALMLGQGVSHAQDAGPPGASTPSPDVAATTPAVPGIDDFLAGSQFSDMKLSPSGNYLAILKRAGSKTVLVVTDTGTSAPLRFEKQFNGARVGGLEWIGDNRLIYLESLTQPYVIRSSRGTRVVGLPKLFAIDRELTTPLAFFQNEKRDGKVDLMVGAAPRVHPNDDTFFYIQGRVSDDLDLFKVNAHTGSWSKIADGNGSTVGWYADAQGTPALRMDSDRRFTEISIFTPDPKSNDQVRWTRAVKLRVNRETNRTADLWPLAPGPDARTYYVLARAPGADRAGVHLYNFAARTFVREIFTHPVVDIENALFDPVTGAYVAAMFWNDAFEMAFSDPGLRTHYEHLRKTFGDERGILVVDRSNDQTVWIVATEGPRDPGSYYLYDTKTTQVTEIGRANPHLEMNALGVTQSVTYEARDGLSIRGYLTFPPHLADGEKPPLIVYPHGGPEVRDVKRFDDVVQFLATRGYAVFQPNFRGSSGYGDAFAKAGRRQFGRAMQTDVIDGVNFVLSRGEVDPSRICIFGESYGGYAALMDAVRTPDRYRCVVSSAGLSDLYRQIRWDRSQDGWDSMAYKYWVEQLGNPDKAVERAEMQANSPVHQAAAIKASVLLVHGRKDDIVPFEQVEFMRDALAASGRPAEELLFENAGHGFWDDDRKRYFEELERFFGEHLKLPAMPQAAQTAQ